MIRDLVIVHPHTNTHTAPVMGSISAKSHQLLPHRETVGVAVNQVKCHTR